MLGYINLFKQWLLQGWFCRHMFLGSHTFPYQSLLLSTTVLNDINFYHCHNYIIIVKHIIPGMRNQGLCVHKIWPIFKLEKSITFCLKHTIYMQFVPLRQRSIENLITFSIIQKGRYPLKYKQVYFVHISPIFSCLVTYTYE